VIAAEAPRFVYAPVRKGTRAGTVTVTVNGRTEKTVVLVYGETVALDKSVPLTRWEKLRGSSGAGKPRPRLDSQTQCHQRQVISMQQRLQKILSAHGVSSRRESERLIESGRVSVNGVPAVLGQSADPDFDDIRVDGAPVRAGVHKLYIMLNKPKGYVTTLKDERGRRSVAEARRRLRGARLAGRPARPRFEGLLILTNDGELTHFLTHPSNEKPRHTACASGGDVTGARRYFQALCASTDTTSGRRNVRLLGRTPDGGNLDVTITEGRNRQVRKMCDAAGLGVVSLRRVAEGGLHLGRLKAGDWRYLTAEEVSRAESGGWTGVRHSGASDLKR
jgi:23S rRNA pseudouridine2605 synthase